MDTPFVYDNHVTGKNFVGRKTECTVLANLLEAGENICLYEPPKAGKTSLNPDSFTSLIVVDGEGSVSVGDESESFVKGDSIFIPAGESEIEFSGSFEIVLTQI
jgi:mannose-6-phosphate isomerase class I